MPYGLLIFSFKISSIFPPLNTVLICQIIQYNNEKIKKKTSQGIILQEKWDLKRVRKEVMKKEFFILMKM